MFNQILNLLRSRTFKKTGFKFNGRIPQELSAIFVFPEDTTPFLPALGLFYSLAHYHKSILAVGIPEISEAFKFHFPHNKFMEFNKQDMKFSDKYRDSVVYLGSIYRDTFYNFPEICRGRFSVASRGFDPYYNFLVHIHFSSYPEFVSGFLGVLGIPDLTDEFLKSQEPYSGKRKDHAFVDFKDPSRFRKHLSGKIKDRIFSTFKHQDVEFIGDLSFKERLKILSSACCLITDDSLFTGYALHYHVPVYSENCSKYFNDPLCKGVRELI